MWYVYTMEYYSVIKKEKNPTICNNMDLEGIMLNKMSDKDKYYISLTCAI